jgi:23S rRNA (guanosine2251-2'-O)-methyltransferase
MTVYGRHPVLEALKEGRVRRLWVARGVEEALLRELRTLGARFELVPRIELDRRLGTTHHQGIAAELEEIVWMDPEAPLRRAQERRELPLVVLLDGITDPRNYGAILRSARALGAHGVVSEERRSAPLSPVALKASAGAAYDLPLVRVKNLPRYQEFLKSKGLWIYGASLQAAKPLRELDLRRPLALIIGSEGKGLRRLVAERCDELVRIPLEGVESLNAAVALGIFLYEIREARE